MPQHTIAMNSDAFAELSAFQHRMAKQGCHYSISRLVTYLLMFVKKVSDEAYPISNIADPASQAKAYRDLIVQAMSMRPDPVRRHARPCHKATPEQRAMVVQQIILRLGIKNPSKTLVDEYLDQGGMDPMIGSKVGRPTPDLLHASSLEAEARQALEESKDREKTQQEPLKTPLWSAPSNEP